MNDLSLKLGLGSAQWGMNYGVSNLYGQTNHSEVQRILEYAASVGIDFIDTAQAYGNAENVIGSNGGNNFNIVTKIPQISPFNTSIADISLIMRKHLKQSLYDLRVNHLYGLLLHSPDDLFSIHAPIILKTLIDFKIEGIVKNIGVSVYNVDQIHKVLECFTPDFIQLPFNIFDQRLLHDGTLKELKNKNIEIHARSIFLQGLIIMPINSIPKYFQPWLNRIYSFHSLCDEQNISPKKLALSFVASCPYIDRIIIGTNNLLQLEELYQIGENDCDPIDCSGLSISDPDFLNPSVWEI